MNWNQIWTVFAKEVRDALRDRRTLISMLVFPALLIPGLMFGFGLVMVKLVSKAKDETPAVMILGAAHSPALRQAFEASTKLRVVPEAADYARQISDKRVRAAVEIPEDFDRALLAGESRTVRIYTYEGEMKSGFAAGELDRVLNEYRQNVVQAQLTARNLPATFVKPFEIKRQNVAPPEKVGGNLFGGFVPYLLILLSFIGAMYPAIDLTAGEKERGTMETILCSPVGRTELVLGKFLTVLAVSLSTVVVSVLSLTLSAMGMAAMLQDKLAAAAKTAGAASAPTIPMIDPLGVLGVFVMVVPLAAMFAAILFTTALFAKSHKEAQTYISPFMMVIILPAVAAMLPGVELNLGMAFVPVLNVSLLSKELVSGSYPVLMMLVSFLSSCLYGSLALFLAVKMFQRESVLFRT